MFEQTFKNIDNVPARTPVKILSEIEALIK